MRLRGRTSLIKIQNELIATPPHLRVFVVEITVNMQTAICRGPSLQTSMSQQINSTKNSHHSFTSLWLYHTPWSWRQMSVPWGWSLVLRPHRSLALFVSVHICTGRQLMTSCDKRTSQRQLGPHSSLTLCGLKMQETIVTVNSQFNGEMKSLLYMCFQPLTNTKHKPQTQIKVLTVRQLIWLEL